jgi:hypothetical protein
MDLGGATASLEFWVYTTSANSCLVTKGGTAASYSTTNGIEYTLALISSQFTWYYNNGGANGTLTDSITRSLNTWYHVVFASNATILSLFVDGTRTATATAGIVKPTTRTSVRIGLDWGTAYYSGYFSNIRFIQGTGAYDASLTTLTVPTAPLTAVANTSLLTLQDATIKDNSTNAFTLTATGTPTPKTFNPFGYTTSSKQSYTPAVYGGSMSSDGTGDYISIASNNVLAFGTGDYTIEMWVYLKSYAQASFWESNPIGTAGSRTSGFIWYIVATGVVYVYFNSANFITSSANVIPLNQWTHIALVRNSGTTNFYVNGVSVASAATSYNSTQSAGIIGAFCDGGTYSIDGYVSNLRAIKGTAVYTNTFLPSLTPVTSIATTSFLLGNSPAIADYSMQNNLETVGDAKISTAVKKYNNASLYFDGTGDYLKSPLNPGFAFGTGNFTIEAWVYVISYAGTCAVLDTRTSGNEATGVIFYITATGMLSIYNSAALVTASTALTVNTWNHVAVTRNSTTVNLWLNGVSVGSGTVSTNFTQQNGYVGAAYTGSANLMNGYIDDLRITNGVARYTANFTAPTSALIAQ